jgi:hypothetical protein
LRSTFLNLVPILVLIFASFSCTSTREFWRYVVEDEVDKPMAAREEGTPDEPRGMSPHHVKVVYNDGSTATEVLIPVLSSGQQILIDHKSQTSPKSLSLTPLPPAQADASVEEAYVKGGHSVDEKSPPVSLVKTHERIRELVKEGNYALALQFADQLLARYPNHLKTLQAKGSLLLRMGEREAALQAYYRAQEIDADDRVAKQIENIEKGLDTTANETP